MSDEQPSPRHYSDKEVALILRRAASIQRSEPSARDPTGLTLSELEEIAREAGIDPRHIRRAASEVGVEGTYNFGARLAGAPISIRIERQESGELAPEAFEELVPLIEQATEGHGQASTVGQTLTWSSATSGNTSSQQVLVSSKAGQTLIRIEENVGGLAGALFGGIMGGVGGGMGIGMGGALGGALGSIFLAVGIPVAVIGASYWGARTIFVGQVRRRRRKLEELAEAIASRIQGGRLGMGSDAPQVSAGAEAAGGAGRRLEPGPSDNG